MFQSGPILRITGERAEALRSALDEICWQLASAGHECDGSLVEIGGEVTATRKLIYRKMSAVMLILEQKDG